MHWSMGNQISGLRASHESSPFILFAYLRILFIIVCTSTMDIGISGSLCCFGHQQRTRRFEGSLLIGGMLYAVVSRLDVFSLLERFAALVHTVFFDVLVHTVFFNFLGHTALLDASVCTVLLDACESLTYGLLFSTVPVLVLGLSSTAGIRVPFSFPFPLPLPSIVSAGDSNRNERILSSDEILQADGSVWVIKVTVVREAWRRQCSTRKLAYSACVMLQLNGEVANMQPGIGREGG
jgi:hypothetical protein